MISIKPLLQIALLFMVALTAHAADPNMPRPGLYKLEFDTNVTSPYLADSAGGKSDSATGQITQIINGKAVNTFQGKPQNICVDDPLKMKNPIPNVGNCKAKYVVGIKETTITSQCEHADMLSVNRKISDNVYQSDVTLTQKSMSAMRGIDASAEGMEAMMAMATTPEEREKIRQAMAQGPSIAERKAQAAEMIAAMEAELKNETDPSTRQAMQKNLDMMKGNSAPSVLMKTTARQIWTRIGNCTK